MRKIFILVIFVFNFILPVYATDIVYEKDIKYYCNSFDVDYNLAVAILLVENPEQNKNIIRTNNDGSKDIGLFQINSTYAAEVMDKCNCTNLLDVKQNIKCGVWCIYRWKFELERSDIPVTPFNLAVMYHRPADMKKIWNGKYNNSGYEYAQKVMKIYYQ